MTALLYHLPGRSCQLTPDKYKQIWRFTTDHLRKIKGLHNIITCYYRDHFKGRNEYLERYPGDCEVNGLDVVLWLSIGAQTIYSMTLAQRPWATALLEAERRFHRIKGYRDIPVLIERLQEVIDHQEAAA